MSYNIVIGDLHIKPDNLDVIDIFYKKCLHALKIMDPPPTNIVLLGDILHHHQKVYIPCLNTALQIITGFSQISPTIVLVGNHDMADSKNFLTKNHWMHCCKLIPRVTVVDTPAIINGAAYIPYTPPELFMDAVHMVSHEPFQWVYTHQEFAATVSHPPDSLKAPLIPHKYIISGHVHEKQWLAGRCYYPGSCLTNTYTSINTPPKTIARVELKDAAMSMSQCISEIDLDVPQCIEMKIPLKEYIPLRNIDPRHQYRIILSGSLHDIEKFRKTFRKSPHGKNVKLFFNVTDALHGAHHHDGAIADKSFIQLLSESIADDDHAVLKEFRRVFAHSLPVHNNNNHNI